MFPDQEWSGILFFKTEGDLDDIPNMVFTTYDFVLQDIGKKAHTQFENGEDLIDIFLSDKSLRKHRMGLMHSHNTMPTFFSGEDMDELKDNTHSTDFYLSLIVNNRFEPKAKIAFRSKKRSVGSSEIVSKTISGKKLVNKIEVDEEVEIMTHIDLEIEMEGMQTLERDLIRYQEKAKSFKSVQSSPAMRQDWNDRERELNEKQKYDARSGRFNRPPYFVSERQQEIDFGEKSQIARLTETEFRSFMAKLITTDNLFEDTLYAACQRVKTKLKDDVEIDLYVDYTLRNLENYFTYSSGVDIVTYEDEAEILERMVPILSKILDDDRQNEPIRRMYIEASKMLKEMKEEMDEDKVDREQTYGAEYHDSRNRGN